MGFTIEERKQIKKLLAKFKSENPKATYHDFRKLIYTLAFCFFLMGGKELMDKFEQPIPEYGYWYELFEEET